MLLAASPDRNTCFRRSSCSQTSHDARRAFISSCEKTNISDVITFREIEVCARHPPVFKCRGAEWTLTRAAVKRHLVPRENVTAPLVRVPVTVPAASGFLGSGPGGPAFGQPASAKCPHPRALGARGDWSGGCPGTGFVTHRKAEQVSQPSGQRPGTREKGQGLTSQGPPLCRAPLWASPVINLSPGLPERRRLSRTKFQGSAPQAEAFCRFSRFSHPSPVNFLKKTYIAFSCCNLANAGNIPGTAVAQIGAQPMPGPSCGISEAGDLDQVSV